jgi:type I restriction enzyme S subunit
MRKVWPTVLLGEVLTPTKRGESVDASKEYRLLGIRLDGQGPFLRETLMGAQSSATKLFRVAKGDFIYSRLFACRGAFGVICEELDGCYVSGEFPTFIPVPGKVDVQFLKYWFRLPGVSAAVDEDCSGSTPLTRNRFKENFFLALEIPLPPLAEQRRVVARIEDLAAQIHEARTLRGEIETDLKAMLAAKHRQIAENAPRNPLGEVAPLTRRPVAVNVEKSYPAIAVRSFGRGTFHKPPLVGSEVTWEKPFRVEAGDILVSNIKAWEGALAVASTEDHGRVGSHRYLTCVPIEGIATARFVCFYLLTPEGLYEIGEASPGSADRNRTLSQKRFMSIPIPVPKYAEQLRFDALCREVDALKRLQAETSAKLDALLPAILDKAFNGQL